MSRIFTLIGSGLGSAAGWWLGARVGLMTAFLLSSVGAGVGFYYGAKFAREMLP